MWIWIDDTIGSIKFPRILTRFGVNKQGHHVINISGSMLEWIGSEVMNRSSDMRLTMVDTVWPRTGLIRDIVVIGIGALLTVLLTRIEIPLAPIPITGQTFAVLLVGALLGSKRGALSMITYIGMGLIGAPVFSKFGWGISHLAGPTGGYLVGFVLAAFLVGWLSERGWDRRVLTTVIAMSLGMIAIYASGCLWLGQYTGWDKVLNLGVVPFLAGDALKIACAAVALPSGWALLGATWERGAHLRE
jgi:biotin transporter BioY